MNRFLVAVFAFSLVAPSAEAARLVHPSAAVKTAEKGVSVWRGPPLSEREAPDNPAIAAPCLLKTVVVTAKTFPERRLRVEGFWSGDGLTPGMRMTRRPLTQGFYADRLAAGL